MKKTTIIILHGWRASAESFKELNLLFENRGFTVEVSDLPGFGNAPLVKDPMTLEDYVNFAKEQIGERKVILMGHSFGGRIAIVIAAKYPELISKLILTGASGIVHQLTLMQKITTFIAKVGKITDIFLERGEAESRSKEFSIHSTDSGQASSNNNPFRKYLYSMLGVNDYYSAGSMRSTFQKVYRVDVGAYLSNISAPTLLVWGEKDSIIPLSDAMRMGALIPNATLVVVKGATHKLPYEMPHVFLEKILPFLRD